MLVHMSHAGAIIGKGGSKIKELREESGCNIKVISLFYLKTFMLRFIPSVLPSRRTESFKSLAQSRVFLELSKLLLNSLRLFPSRVPLANTIRLTTSRCWPMNMEVVMVFLDEISAI